jgi:hypothetical protein
VPSHSPTQSSAASIEVRSRPRGSAAFTVQGAEGAQLAVEAVGNARQMDCRLAIERA